ncbi:hypothetical protein V8C86DRAFT_2900200 [Haematococcus lacustris]
MSKSNVQSLHERLYGPPERTTCGTMALCELPARCSTPTSVLGCYYSFLSDSGLGLGDEPLPLLQPLDSSAFTGAGVSNGPQAEPRQVRVKRPRSPSSTTWKRANERFKELTAQAKLARDTYQTVQRANAMLKTRLRVLEKAILTCDEQVGILERYQQLHRLHSSSSSGAPGSPPPSALSHSTVSAVKAAQTHNPWLPSLSAALGSHSSTAGPLEEPHGGLLHPQPAAGAAASILARPVSEPGQGGAAAAPSLASGAAGELHMLQQLASLPASQLFPFGREVLEQLSSCLLAGSQPGAQLQLARVTRSMSWATSCMCMLNPLQYHLMAGLNVGHAFTSGVTTDVLQASGCSAQARAGGGRQPGAWGRRTQVVAEHQCRGRLPGSQAQAHCSKGGPALHSGGVAAVAGLAAGPCSCSSRDSRVEAGLLAAPSQPSTCAPSTAAAGGCLEACSSSLCGGGWEWEDRQAGQQRSQRLWTRLQAERDALYQQGLPLHMSAQALPACRLEPGQMAELHEALGLFIRMMKRVRSQREALLRQHWQLTEAARLAGPGACSSLAAWALMDRLDANLQQEGRAISTLCFLVWGRILKASQLAEVMMATMPYVPSLPALLGEVLMGWPGP